MVEVAVAFPLLVLTALALVQLALFVHAQSVVAGAVQDGAWLASTEGRTVAEGVAHTQALLVAGLGRSAQEVSVQGIEGGDAVAVAASGRLRLVIPWVADASLPLGARALVSKEHFRVGPS